MIFVSWINNPKNKNESYTQNAQEPRDYWNRNFVRYIWNSIFHLQLELILSLPICYGNIIISGNYRWVLIVPIRPRISTSIRIHMSPPMEYSLFDKLDSVHTICIDQSSLLSQEWIYDRMINVRFSLCLLEKYVAKSWMLSMTNILFINGWSLSFGTECFLTSNHDIISTIQIIML